MKEILDKILGFFQKILPAFVLIGLLIFAYITFNKPTFDIFTININNPIKSMSNIIDDTILYGRAYNTNIHKNEVVIVKIDEKTLNAFSKTDVRMLSFPKKLYSDLIIKLIENYDVSTIGFDIIFLNKSLIGEEDENILMDTFTKYDDRIVIASMSDGINKPLCKYNNVQHGSIGLHLEPRIRKTLLDTNYIVGNGCEDNNIYLGNKGTLESFGFNIFKKHSDRVTKINKLEEMHKLYEIFKEENTPFININYFRNGERNEGAMGYRSYSLIDILNGEDIDLKGKIIIIGEVGTVLHDSHFTPVNFNVKMPGVEINANIVTTFLYDSFLKDFNQIYLFFIIIIFSIIILLLIFNNNILISLFGLFVIILVNISFGIFAFGRLGIIYPVSMVLYFILISFFGMYVYKFFVLDKDKRFLKSAFSMYVSSDMVNKISDNPKDLDLKGNKGDITVFFSDIESFTSISEKMEAQNLFDFLNRYFHKMTGVLIKNRGTLDKYIGDGIMGFFNAPLPLEKHEYYACKTALEQLEALKSLNDEFKLEGLPILNIRIGINTGEVIHGNLGSRGKRLNYTIIGDNVNLAARLEGVNKIYGTNIIVSESVYNKVFNDFIFRELDNVTVKGKNKPVKVYELVCFKESKHKKTMLNNYSFGLNKYYLEEYEEAIEFFSKNNNDKASVVMKDRCKKILKGELEIKKGVHKIETK